MNYKGFEITDSTNVTFKDFYLNLKGDIILDGNDSVLNLRLVGKYKLKLECISEKVFLNVKTKELIVRKRFPKDLVNNFFVGYL